MQRLRVWSVFTVANEQKTPRHGGGEMGEILEKAHGRAVGDRLKADRLPRPHNGFCGSGRVDCLDELRSKINSYLDPVRSGDPGCNLAHQCLDLVTVLRATRPRIPFERRMAGQHVTLPVRTTSR